MGRRKVTARFYVLLLLVLGVSAFFIVRKFMPAQQKIATIQAYTAPQTHRAKAVIVRDESVVSFEGFGRVNFVAEERQEVAAGDEVAHVYKAEYSEKEMGRLEEVRQKIRDYHQEILAEIVDPKLEQLDNNVHNKAAELATLVRDKSAGSFFRLQQDLQQAMTDRQEYLRQNRREDINLNQLYEEEQRRITKFESWQTVEKAATAGVVSFYLDGYEGLVTPSNVGKLTAGQVRSVIAGEPVQGQGQSRMQQPVFRLINTQKWNLMILTEELDWNPVAGQVYRIQMDGYPDLVYNASVLSIQKGDQESLILMEVGDPMGPLIDERSGAVTLGANIEGMYVPNGAIFDISNTTGVYLADAAGGTFIEVTILARDNSGALIMPVVESTLSIGQQVYMH